MRKYRLKINKKISGPFGLEEIVDMITTGEVSSEVDCQVYPEGEWNIITKFPEFRDLDYSASFPDEYSGEEIVFDSASSDIEKTIIRDKPQRTSQLDQTVLRDIGLELDIKENTKITTNLNDNNKSFEKRNDPPETIDPNEETRQIDLGEIREKLREEALKSEETFDLEIAKSIVKAKERKISISQDREILSEEIVKYEKKESQKRQLNPVLVLILFAAFLYLFFDEEKPEVAQPKEYFKRIEIMFPREFDPPDPNQAEAFYREGRLAEKDQSYLNRLRAKDLYFKSVENQFYKNPALGKLILIYAQYLTIATNPTEGSKIIHDLLKVFKGSSLDHLDYVTARAIFFYQVKKYRAAQTVIENYNLNNKPSIPLFTVYLNVLIELGDFVKAQKVLTALDNAGAWPVDTYLAVVRYHASQEDFSKMNEILTRGLASHENSLPLLLQLARLQLKNQDFKSLAANLKILRDKNYDYHPEYFADYLMFSGLVAAADGEVSKATEYFEKSLEVKDTTYLRDLLANVSQTEDEKLNKLVKESKANILIRDSKSAEASKNFEMALIKAIEATEIASNYIEAILNLADLQIRQGYFQAAIQTLDQSIKTINLEDKVKISFKMIDVYIQAYKFSDAKQLAAELLSFGDMVSNSDYYRLLGDLFFAQGDYTSALARYRKSLNLDPLNDNIAFKIAKMLLSQSQFKQARSVISKAIELNPGSIDYRIFYSKVLYELENSETALGYLRDTLREFPDNEQLLSAIGILYYRSGQQKYFLDIKKKLQSGAQGSELYEFLVEAAILDDDDKSIIEYAQKLIELQPGNLKNRMLLARVLVNNNKYKEAIKVLQEVSSRLDTYPGLKLLQSKIAIEMKDHEAALKYIEKEIAANPYIIDAYVLKGEIFLKRGDYEEAKKAYTQAQKLNPRSTDALLGFAYIKFRQNQHEAAIDLYKKVITLDPSIPEAHLQIGNVYRFLGRNQLAIESYKVYLDLLPEASEKAELDRYIKKLQ